jgi:DNA replication protein DnaC
MTTTLLEKKQSTIWPASSESLSAKTCPECSLAIEPFVSPVTGRVIYPTCPCVLKKERLAVERLLNRSKTAKLERFFKGCAVGETLPNADFKSWVERPGAKTAYKAAYEYAEELPNKLLAGQGLLLFGPPGCGKSHLVAAAARRAIESGYSVLFERAPKLLMRLRDVYSSQSSVSELEIIEALGRLDLLVIDDLGAEKKTEWSVQTIYTIIDERYSKRRATLITTNLSLEELEQKVGPRTMDRLVGSCRFVENCAASYRQEQALICWQC